MRTHANRAACSSRDLELQTDTCQGSNHQRSCSCCQAKAAAPAALDQDCRFPGDRCRCGSNQSAWCAVVRQTKLSKRTVRTLKVVGTWRGNCTSPRKIHAVLRG